MSITRSGYENLVVEGQVQRRFSSPAMDKKGHNAIVCLGACQGSALNGRTILAMYMK